MSMKELVREKRVEYLLTLKTGVKLVFQALSINYYEWRWQRAGDWKTTLDGMAAL